MLFNSIEFLLFFPIVVSIYFTLPFKFRWLLLLVASYFFYASVNGKLLYLIIISTLIDYFAALRMDNSRTKKEKRPFLIISIISNLGILCLFKYYNFFIHSFEDLLDLLNIGYAIPALNLILPVGISFYTFQTIGYTVDVYRGKIRAEHHLGYFALYVSYFPQLVAGPIEKSTDLLPSLKKEWKIDYDRMTSGLKLMAWGFFKKIVIADQIAPMIENVKASPDDFGGFSVFLCSVLFSFQIYCDFSAYSDIAIGGARVMGVKLKLNFRRPFFSKNLSEFWIRWHISLIDWFKEYIFFPLGGSRRGKLKTYRNILIVFFISGLWHGAGYNFIIWGIINGLIVVVSSILLREKIQLQNVFLKKLYAVFLRLRTFFFFTILIVFIYAENIDLSLKLYNNLMSDWGKDLRSIIDNHNNSRSHVLYLGYSVFEFFFVIFSLLLLFIVEYAQEYQHKIITTWQSHHFLIRWFSYISITLLIMLFSFDKEVPFYYFRF